MPHKPAPRRGHRRVPAFSPVPLRSRAGGWTPEKQAAFLGALAVTGSVRAAAQRVDMSRETAYRLRRKRGAQSFARAWDVALRGRLERSRRVTRDEIAQRALHGLLKPLIYAGRHVATVRKPDFSALLRHLAQLDRAGWAKGCAAGRVGSFAARTASTAASSIPPPASPRRRHARPRPGPLRSPA
jgi:hypothetical protein